MNRLASESSPYLLQHAENPVDWYPWGEEAFAKARDEQKPILLSVGYSSCHWCHVMAHESFENEAIAALMNEGFVSVKVDREERPDVDSVYMTFTQAMTGHGGWPMTVFLTPELEPFFAGTYYPPDDRYGRPGFPQLLRSVRHAWETNREGVLQSATELTAKVRAATARQTEGGGAEISAATADAAFEAMRGAYDSQWGGFGRAPKFPSPSNLEFLLMYGQRTGNASATGMALHTCRRMTQGGMYDHLGGGFARYSVDERWLVPHFEKMLYDNALLARLYVHAFQVSDHQPFADTARETLDYLEREMLDPAGGFYAAQDADSEGIEGKFFVWTPAEIDDVIGAGDGPIVRAVFGVTEDGNFQDPHHPEFGRRSVLSRPRSLEEVAEEFGRTADELEAALPGWKQQLLQARQRRVPPGLDDKVLTSWNGLAIAAFAEAGRVLDEPRYIDRARRTAEFIRDRMRREDRLLHSYRAGEAKVDGLLEDYAYVGLGLVDLYRATGSLEYLRWAAELCESAILRFRDTPKADDSLATGDGTFFESPWDGEALVLRQKPFFDAPTPSGNAAMALLSYWTGRYLGLDEWQAMSREIVRAVADQLPRAATGFGAMLQALELQVAPPREIAIVGPALERAPFEREVARRYLPAILLAPAAVGEGLPVLDGRSVTSGAAAYVCENMACDLPATTVAALVGQLDR